MTFVSEARRLSAATTPESQRILLLEIDERGPRHWPKI
jgi:hypothetical protein